METGLFDILLFNFDEWLAGDKFRITGTENSPSKAIYRGWMLKPEKYDELYKTLHDRGVQSIVFIIANEENDRETIMSN